MTNPEHRDPDRHPAERDVAVPNPDATDGWHRDGHVDPDAARGARRSTATAALLVALGVSALGGIVGWVWAEITPRLQVIKSDKGFLYADAEPEQPIAADGWFFLLALGLGIALALLAWFVLRRYRGVAMLAALTVGSAIGAVFALWVGYKISSAQFTRVAAAAPVGAQLSAPIAAHITDLSARDLNADAPAALWGWPPRLNGVLAIQAWTVAVVYTVMAGFSLYPDLGRRRPPPTPDADPDLAPPPA